MFMDLPVSKFPFYAHSVVIGKERSLELAFQLREVRQLEGGAVIFATCSACPKEVKSLVCFKPGYHCPTLPTTAAVNWHPTAKRGQIGNENRVTGSKSEALAPLRPAQGVGGGVEGIGGRVAP